MRKFIATIAAFLLLTAPTAQAETLNLAGRSAITLEILQAAAATELAESLLVAQLRILANKDSITAVHLDLLTRALANRDSVKNAHTNLLARIVAGIDTTKNAHTNLLARIVAGIDTTKNTHTAVKAFEATINGATGILREQADTAVNVTALSDSETTILNFRTANTRYLLRNLRLKGGDPGGNTATVNLYEFINDAFIKVDSFAIATGNYATYHNLYDMFGETQLAGDNLMITVQMDAGTLAITGQYSYAKTNN